MNSQELRNLQEAYLEVVENQQLDEADSLAAMEARRQKRLAAQRKREGTTATGRDFGRDDSLSAAQQKARRESEFKAGTKKEDVEYVDEDSRRMSNKQHTQRVRSNIKSFGSNYTPPSNYDPDANRGKGEVLTRKQMEKKRRKALRQEEVDIYDIILSHLLDEGYAETPEAAESIMVNMSEEWRDSIVEEVISEGRRTSLSALSRESQARKADKERGRPETQDEKHRRLAMGRYSPSQYKWKKVDGQWKNMGRKDGEKD